MEGNAGLSTLLTLAADSPYTLVCGLPILQIFGRPGCLEMLEKCSKSVHVDVSSVLLAKLNYTQEIQYSVTRMSVLQVDCPPYQCKYKCTSHTSQRRK